MVNKNGFDTTEINVRGGKKSISYKGDYIRMNSWTNRYSMNKEYKGNTS